jgi:copper chaperone
MTQVTLTVPDISCEHCEHTITQALVPVDGVRRVKVDIPTKQVLVDYDENRVDVDHMKHVLEEEDYPVAAVARPA